MSTDEMPGTVQAEPQGPSHSQGQSQELPPGSSEQGVASDEAKLHSLVVAEMTIAYTSDMAESFGAAYQSRSIDEGYGQIYGEPIDEVEGIGT
eukprot:jgi/Mesen1/10123/ME000075S09621